MEPEVQIQVVVANNFAGGYDFEFVDELSRDKICPICLFAMRNPVQTETCGHRFCKECLLETFRKSNGRICPKDRNPIPEEELFRDKAWNRDIISLRVKCKRNQRGCDWIGQLHHYQEHVMACLYEDVACTDCDENVQRRSLLSHATECHKRIVQCEWCKEKFEFWRTEVHEGEECTRFPLDCPQQCGVTEIPREELESHITDDCLMTVVACPYKDAGCNFSDKRVNLEAHTKGAIEDHLRKTWTQLVAAKEELQKINETEGRVIEIQGQMEQFQTERRQIELSLQRRHVENSELRLLVRELEVENGHLKGAVAELTERLTEEIKSLTDGLQSEKKDREDSFTRNNNANVALKQEVAGLKDNVVSENKELRELMKNMQIRLEALEQKERKRKSVDLCLGTSKAASGEMSKEKKKEVITSSRGVSGKKEDRKGNYIPYRRLEASKTPKCAILSDQEVGGSQDEARKVWSCSTCTYMNSLEHKICVMCAKSRNFDVTEESKPNSRLLKMPKCADQEVGGSQGETRKDSLQDGGNRSIEVIQKGKPDYRLPRPVFSSWMD